MKTYKKMKRIEIKNFTTLTKFDNGEPVRPVLDAEGKEIGFDVRGMLTTFDVRNENGQVFTSMSYDRFVDDYFLKNSLNVPVCVQHIEDIFHLCGYVLEMTKTADGVEVIVRVMREAYFYNVIKAFVRSGVLQGFSNCGYVEDAQWNDSEEALVVTGFALMHVALVTTPSDTGGKFAANTIFRGFAEGREETKENEKEEKSDALPLIL